MNRILCPECHGQQVEWRETVLIDCSRCLGQGWVSLPAEVFGPRRLIVGAAVLSIVLLVLCYVAVSA